MDIILGHGMSKDTLGCLNQMDGKLSATKRLACFK